MAKEPVIKKQPSSKFFPVESVEVTKEATGTESAFLQQRLLNQVFEALWLPDGVPEPERVIRLQSAIDVLQGIKPNGEIEGMLAAQMVGTHNAAMECLHRAMIPKQSYEGRDQNLKHAAKLLSIFSRQIEVLDKHRGKGQQKVTVEYVNVESGGQAIVGPVEAGGSNGPSGKRSKQKPKAIPVSAEEPIDMKPDVDKAASRKKT